MNRSSCRILTVVLFLCVVSVAHSQSYIQEFSPCPPPECTSMPLDWVTAPYQPLVLPEFPGCTLYVRYRYRKCGSNVVDFELSQINFDNPDPTNPNSPCSNLLNEYLASGDFNGKALFSRRLFNLVHSQIARDAFVRELNGLLLETQANPTDPDALERWGSILCPGGYRSYRGMMSTCTVASWIFQSGQGQYKKDDTSAHLMIPPSDGIHARVRYWRCNDNTAPSCCVREYKYCFNEATGLPVETIINHPSQPFGCQAEVDRAVYDLDLGEDLGKCLPYCVDTPPFRPFDNNSILTNR